MLKIPPSWHSPLLAELFKTPRSFVEQEIKLKKTVYPEPSQLFSALELTPLEDVRVVILGQDPYHGEGEAHGLAFSVKEGVKIPPSLVNIFKERETDLKLPAPLHGSLVAWARQGVLLLNTVLSVEKDRAGSHQKKGWEPFTDQIIRMVSEKSQPVVFILWGLPAQKKVSLIDATKHLILTSPHPSPLSSYRGFFGSKPFSKANEFLTKNGRDKIIW